MKITIHSKIWEQGNACVITVPAKYMEWNKLKPGDKVLVTIAKEEDSEKTKEMQTLQEDNSSRDEENTIKL